MIYRNRYLNLFLLVIPDLLLMLLGLRLALVLRFAEITPAFIDLHYKAFVPIFLIWLIVLFVHGLFDFRSLRRLPILFFNLVSAMFINFLAAVLYFYFQPELILTPRRTLILVVIMSFVFILVWRLLFRVILKNNLTEDYYLLSRNGELAEFEAELRNHNYVGLRIIRHISSLDELDDKGNVIISKTLLTDDSQLKQIYELRLKGIVFHNHLEFFERLFKRIPLPHLNELWLVDNIGSFEGRLQGFLKRLSDVVAGIILLVLFIVTFPFIALAIKLNSSGPIFFKQERIGKRGTVFKVYKYRTMAQSSSGRGWTTANDPRVTSVGKLLRRLHLDELPQFINLLLGNMSIVGPRPEQLEIVGEMRTIIPFYDERHLVKPGITGWAQLNIYAGSVEETRRKLEYDLYYLKHRSIWFDLEIILKTLYFIVRNKI